jgi:predicted nuclease with TOPRIM domain
MSLAMSGAMRRETVEVLEARLQTFLARHQTVQGEREALATRLAAVERSNAELTERLRRCASERAEMRSRLDRLLALIGLP